MSDLSTASPPAALTWAEIAGDPLALWRCPRCLGVLRRSAEGLSCSACGADYGTVDGIPDFRDRLGAGGAWAEDLQRARELAAADLALEDLIRDIYRRQTPDNRPRIDLRTRQVLEGHERLRRELAGWLDAPTAGGVFLDLGCGAGMLLAAAASMGRPGVGIDSSMTWLVAAKRLVRARGGEPVLAAGLGEHLPIATGALGAVVSLDVVEHVQDPEAYLSEIERVTARDGRLALSTPNRFSLAPEPHVGLMGVGWLPRPLQTPYVRARSGLPYEGTRLFSSLGLGRALKRRTSFRWRMLTPPVSDEELRSFPRGKQAVARLYNRIHAAPFARALLLAVGPFFRVVGAKAGA